MKNRRLRVVLAGCGSISEAWLGPAKAMPGVAIVGLADINKKAALERKEKFGLSEAEVGSDFRTLLKTTRPDAVFDCTTPESHAQVTLEALRLGCHVLGEKPMSCNMADARKMTAAAKRAGRLYAVMQNRRNDPRIRAYRKLLASGRLGELTTLNSDFYIGAHFGGFRDRMKHPLLLDMAIHTFDAARLISGADAKSVFCHEWNPAGSWYAHGASAIAIFEMTGGAVYCYRGSWCSEGLNTAWECQWRAIGTGGTATWNGANGFGAEAVKHKKNAFIQPVRTISVRPSEGNNASGHALTIRHFIQCIRAGRIPETICTDNIKSLGMVFGAVESAESGKRVKLNQ